MSEKKSENQINEEEWENAANWRLGLFYFSERDSRVWVPKRSMLGRRRYGGTFNLAKPAAQMFFKTIIGGFFLLMFLAYLVQNSGILR